MPPSITYWTRLEPRPRSNAISASLAAPVRDPLWLLARQWQIGEFAGADAGSPVYVELQARAGALCAWMPWSATASSPLGGGDRPLEPIVESEPFAPDLATRVELGQAFEQLLGANPGDQMIADLRQHYPLPLVLDARVDHLFAYGGDTTGLDNGSVPAALLSAFSAARVAVTAPAIWVVVPGQSWLLTDAATRLSYAIQRGTTVDVFLHRDAESIRFLRLCAGRACDGAAILAAARAGGPILPARREWTSAQIQSLAAAASPFVQMVRDQFGDVGTGDPPAWATNRLAWQLQVAVTNTQQSSTTLQAVPGRDGEFEWSSFDLAVGQLPGAAPGALTSIGKTAMPGHVRFRGMPNARWWEFESGRTDFGGIDAEMRDLAKLIVMDFMLIHGDDWYVMALDVPVGSACYIDALLVHDVFGVTTAIARADADSGAAASPGQLWTMFTPSDATRPDAFASCLLVPATAHPTALIGPVLEDVRFARDPVADLVWGIELTVENGVGRPWPGRERNAAGTPSRTPPPPGTPSLRYRLHSEVPANWIPFVAVPQPNSAGVLLQRAALPADNAGGVVPPGRILQVQSVREEEISTEGARVSRVVCRSRWSDGTTRIWIARRRGLGQGQGSAGLRFDVVST